MADTDTGGKGASLWRFLFAWWWPPLARRHPILGLFLVIIWPNALWSVFNLLYNLELIVNQNQICTKAQQDAFWTYGFPYYGTIAWAIGMGYCAWLVRPLLIVLRAENAGKAVTTDMKRLAQRRLINLPWCQLV